MTVRDFDPFVGCGDRQASPGTIAAATHVLASRFGITAQAAFDFLRRMAAGRGVGVTVLAASVVAVAQRQPEAVAQDPALAQLLLDPLADCAAMSVERVVFSRVVG